MGNVQPLVSVIMPVYNCEATISEAIDSIVNQTYKNWELIICDDCSTDGSYMIIEQYQHKLGDKIILLRNEENKKIAATLNHCLEYVSGQYVARMDGDDRSKPKRFELQVDYLNKHEEIDCVGSSRVAFDENGIRGCYMATEYPNYEMRFRSVPFAHPTIMMRASVYQALGGYRVAPETLRAEDVDLWLRFWEMGFKGYNLQDVLLEYRESVDALGKRTIKASVGTTRVLLKYWKKEKAGWSNFFLCFKPILASLIPNRIMHQYHNSKLNKIAEEHQ